MKTDVTIVLYGYDRQEFSATLDTLINSQSCINRVWILISGSKEQHDSVLADISQRDASHFVELTPRFDNLGFAAGHNYLLESCFSRGADRALVLNPDVDFGADALKRLIAESGKYPLALLGPTLAQSNPDRVDDTRRVDSLGIHWNAFGRHLDYRQGEKWIPITTHRPLPVQGVSGACLLVSADVYEHVVRTTDHFFDDLFIAYREDAELGIRAREVGVPSFVIPVEGFRHVRASRGFQRTNTLINMLGVRNRFLILWTLGHHRPGKLLLKAFRDVVVVLAALLVERSSLVGLAEAWAVRRYEKAVRKVL